MTEYPWRDVERHQRLAFITWTETELRMPFISGYSSVLHCAFLLRTIFASLSRAYERVRAQNVGDFTQAELDREINTRFLLNKHSEPHFLI